jgi:P27 family predicted phage terminase small subunit
MEGGHVSRAKANPTGNPRGAVDVTQAPRVHEGRAPRVPASLGTVGKDVWREVWKAGEGAYHPQTDRYVIERYCALHDRRSEFLRVIEVDGLMTIGSTGQPVPHPLLRHVDSTEREMRAIETTLGLNLESRLRLGIAASAIKQQTLADLLGDDDD